MASILWIPIIFCSATSWLYVLTKYAPATSRDQLLKLEFPNTLDELKDLAHLLQEYYQSNPVYVMILFSSAYLYKQAFAIPGSVFLNLLGGTLFGMLWGFPLVCFLCACGASMCYLLSKTFGRDHVLRWFPDKVQLVRTQIEDSDNLFYFLLFARLFPMTPNWFINIVSPILNIPFHLFFASVFIGLMPYNFICVQTGVILRDLHSMDDVLTFGMFFNLAMIAVVALIPVILKKYAAPQLPKS